MFIPIAVKTAGCWNQQAIDAVKDIGPKISIITEDTLTCFREFQLQYTGVVQSPSRTIFHHHFVESILLKLSNVNSRLFLFNNAFNGHC